MWEPVSQNCLLCWAELSFVKQYVKKLTFFFFTNFKCNLICKVESFLFLLLVYYWACLLYRCWLQIVLVGVSLNIVTFFCAYLALFFSGGPQPTGPRLNWSPVECEWSVWSGNLEEFSSTIQLAQSPCPFRSQPVHMPCWALGDSCLLLWARASSY